MQRSTALSTRHRALLLAPRPDRRYIERPAVPPVTHSQTRHAAILDPSGAYTLDVVGGTSGASYVGKYGVNVLHVGSGLGSPETNVSTPYPDRSVQWSIRRDRGDNHLLAAPPTCL
jgi:hypothetical protein